jgi:hypothetical protein
MHLVVMRVDKVLPTRDKGLLAADVDDLKLLELTVLQGTQASFSRATASASDFGALYPKTVIMNAALNALASVFQVSASSGDLL